MYNGVMANPAKFGHDCLGHLLSDRLLKVPSFQRRYTWESEDVENFWLDIQRAQASGDSYFMGTIVLAWDGKDDTRALIIDGQQRIITTALLLIAISDRLNTLNKETAARSVHEDYLSNYSLDEEKDIPRMIVSADDKEPFSQLLKGEVPHEKLPLMNAYFKLRKYVERLTPAPEDYRKLIYLVRYLKEQVQVLTAEANSLQEAYVIFETLNDRGADLTTADLLKNYLFSKAGDLEIEHAQACWTRITNRFDSADGLVQFIRYEYMSRHGHVTKRDLYKALQDDIGNGSDAIQSYLARLEVALSRYIALREPDDSSWSSQAIEIKDSLLAFRRFRFESSMPLLLAVFATWNHTNATRFVETVAAWSVRSLMARTLGGGVAEETFCKAAVAVTNGDAKDVDEVRRFMTSLVPDDATFREAFLHYDTITTTRAKYILACLERQLLLSKGITPESMPDWSSKAVTIDHIMARGSRQNSFASQDDFEKFKLMKEKLQNMTLLERTLNGELEDKPFDDKISSYKKSAFKLTNKIAELNTFDFDAADARLYELAELAVLAWPR